MLGLVHPLGRSGSRLRRARVLQGALEVLGLALVDEPRALLDELPGPERRRAPEANAIRLEFESHHCTSHTIRIALRRRDRKRGSYWSGLPRPYANASRDLKRNRAARAKSCVERPLAIHIE